MRNKKQGIGLIVTVVIIAVIAMVIATILLVVNNNNNKASTNDNGDQNLNSNVTNDNITVVDNDNNKYDVITEDIVRNHNVTPISDLKYEVRANGVAITGYIGNDDIVVVPETINGQNVTEMTVASFGNECTVKGLYIPNTVKVISGICAGNTHIEVVVCEGVEIIGDNTFNSCTSLKTVVLGDSLKSIGENTFVFCSNLKELYIAPTLTTIDARIAPTVFYLCDSLTLHGKTGSYIETFAKEQNIPFVAE